MDRTWIAAGVAAVLASAGTAACRPAVEPSPAAAPAPAPAPAPAAGTPPGMTISDPHDLRACVVQNGRMAVVGWEYNPATGDSTVNGRPLREVYPVTAEYAAVARWYAMNEPITFAGRRYIKYGMPRQLGSEEVVPVGSYQGVPVFAEPGDAVQPREVIFLPTMPGCHFQPYELGETGGAVRG